jgi:hypothetical protein
MNEIEYHNRYSDTNGPDKQGRWARTATYKNIRIAWISKQIINGCESFLVTCHFPTMNNDTSNESKVVFNLEDAKSFVHERWNFFLNTVNK